MRRRKSSRKWEPTPVFLPEKFHGQRSLAGCSPRVTKRRERLMRLNMHTLYEVDLKKAKVGRHVTTQSKKKKIPGILTYSPNLNLRTLGLRACALESRWDRLLCENILHSFKNISSVKEETDVSIIHSSWTSCLACNITFQTTALFPAFNNWSSHYVLATAFD